MPRQPPSARFRQIGPLIAAVLVIAAAFALLLAVGRSVAQIRAAVGRALRLTVFAGVATVLAGSGLAVVLALPQPPPHVSGTAVRPAEVLLEPTLAGHDETEPGPEAAVGAVIPIVMYHNTPANFEDQLVHLEQRGYTVIDLDQALAGMRGKALPAKPVVLTFDDGFADQMTAFEILKRRNTKATFYLIASGEASLWCIGVDRRYGDPLQPPEGCGDAYLNWDQVRELDRSGLITIGAHTVNHRDLAALAADQQRLEIATGKRMLEARLGHVVRHFAYPYGSYNAEATQLVREAGYATAVTTEAGEYQPGGTALTLHRTRDAMALP